MFSNFNVFKTEDYQFFTFTELQKSAKSVLSKAFSVPYPTLTAQKNLLSNLSKLVME